MATENLTQEDFDKLAKDVLADGVVDFEETTRLLGFMTPSVAQAQKYADFKKLLDRVRADGVITPEESAEVAAALKELTAKKCAPLSVTLRLVAMMFLQMMTFPVWFNTIVPYMNRLGPAGERWVPLCGVLMGIGVFASPIGVGDFLSIAVFYPILVSTCGTNGLHNWSIPFLVSFGIAVLAMVLLAVFYRERKEG